GARIDYTRPVTLHAYVPVDGEHEARRDRIERAVWHLSRLDIPGVGEVGFRELAEEDWANAWKEHYHTRKVGRRLVVKPSWLEYQPEPGEVVVELDPGMAFGTGLHPTTDTCLRLIEDLIQGGERVLDLGTGSGILALAAAGLGAQSILALDTESVAVEAATENVRRAGRRAGPPGLAVAFPITVRRGTLPLSGPPQTFDLILANIIARVLVELAADLRTVLSSTGRLLASGIIVDREADVQQAFVAAGLRIVRREQAGDWVTLLLQPSLP
ncbi:MAG: 50S ribosomal protein L11 methyltransferase, partial [Chloroflexota bacterium]